MCSSDKRSSLLHAMVNIITTFDPIVKEIIFLALKAVCINLVEKFLTNVECNKSFPGRNL